MNDFIKHTDTHICGFKNEYSWLSNMEKCIIQWQGLVFMSTEAAYQACKANSSTVAKQFQTLDGLAAKRHSKTIYVRKNWDNIKYEVMAQLVFQKFLVHEDLREKLIETGNKYIEETNNWNDTYFGVCNGKGQNMLGKILMNTRAYFQNEHND